MFMVAVPSIEIWNQILRMTVYARHYFEGAQQHYPLRPWDTMPTQHQIFRNLFDLQTLVHSINTNQVMHPGLRNNARSMGRALFARWGQSGI